jgi:hypothetical protein
MVTDFVGMFRVTYEMAREQAKEYDDDEGKVNKWRLRKWILEE